MINKLLDNFLKCYDEDEGLNIIRKCKKELLYNIGFEIGKYILKLFPCNINIIDETGTCGYHSCKYIESYDIYSESLKYLKNLTEEEVAKLRFNQNFCIKHVLDRYIYYDKSIVDSIINRKKEKYPKITFTITSCKRFDLFEKTMNSFLNCCNDIGKIDKWFCVDDNSCVEDRKRMLDKYPFFEFYMKTSSEKGHSKSMNIIKKSVCTPYFFHMEDDWKFFEKRNYISDCLEVLGDNKTYGQCLINKNYIEIVEDIDIKGGFLEKTKSGLKYYRHEYCPDEKSKLEYAIKYGNSKTCSYWAHFSFRPSLIRKQVLDKVGFFNENAPHFEMDYAYRYIGNFTSVFLDSIYCIHIGRLTSQINNKNIKNAYGLNNQPQFTKEDNQEKIELDETEFKVRDIDICIRTFVINLDHREDRWIEFNKNAPLGTLEYNRFSAINGKKLISTRQLQRIFDGNDYNMRYGIVGCAMSHIKLYIELINSESEYFVILEDDITFVEGFNYKLLGIMKKLTDKTKKNEKVDIVYLGNHLYEEYKTIDTFSQTKLPEIEKWSTTQYLIKSPGGTGGYIISKYGAKRLLDFINKNGMTNGIDTMQQKAADSLEIYYTYPHLIYSTCYDGVKNSDTDIQKEFGSLTVSIEKRIDDEIKLYDEKVIKVETFQDAIKYVVNSELENIVYYQDNLNIINKLISIIQHPYYTLDKTVLFIIPKTNINKYPYFDILKKKGKYNIEDTLLFINKVNN